MASIVEQYWSGVARRLQEEVDVFNRLIGHMGERGRANELSLTQLLERLLPRRYSVGSGMIIDSEGNTSNQTDIIIYDSANQPTIMAQTTQVLFPVETVELAIEVKTTLDGEAVEDFAEKKTKHKTLVSRAVNATPPFGLLAYASLQPPTVARSIDALTATQKPDIMCVVNPGILAGEKRLLSENDSDQYIVGLAALHSVSEDGERQSSQWQRPTKDERRTVLRGGVSYPATRLGLKEEERIIGEPGRALLIYCVAILKLLAHRRGLSDPYLSHYLQGPAQELVLL